MGSSKYDKSETEVHRTVGIAHHEDERPLYAFQDQPADRLCDRRAL